MAWGRLYRVEVRDPKPRMVSAASFVDRVVHHALCAVVEPIFGGQQTTLHRRAALKLN